MAFSISKTLWSLSAVGAAIIAGSVARGVVKSGWRKINDEDPPVNPASPETSWSDALKWTVLSGLAVGLGRLLARRGVAAVWHQATDAPPPGA